MRVYIAGSRREIDKVKEVQAICMALGMEITFDWTGEEGEIREDWSDVPERAERIAFKEAAAVMTADLLILVWTDKGIGNRLETGGALLSGKQTIILGEPRESVFWYLPNCTRIKDTDELQNFLERIYP